MNPSDELRALHARYCQLTQLELRWNYNVEHLWFLWKKEGNTAEDLELTVKYLSRLYHNNPTVMSSCLRLHRLIGDTLFFAEYLAEARKVARVKAETEKASVLRATGREPSPPVNARPVREILESDAFRDFVKLKEKL